jgi:hypothetical protein
MGKTETNEDDGTAYCLLTKKIVEGTVSRPTLLLLSERED